MEEGVTRLREYTFRSGILWLSFGWLLAPCRDEWGFAARGVLVLGFLKKYTENFILGRS